jgi:AcrR family transcriptional regulator
VAAPSSRASRTFPPAGGDDLNRGASTTGRRRSERSREATLRATLHLLEQHGVNGVTIEGIAAEAGVGKTTIYRWWPSRIALVLDALEQLPELDVPDHGDFARDVRELLENFRTLLTTTPLGGVLAHLGGDANHRDPEVRAYMDRRTADGLAMVERAIARGELPTDTDTSAVFSLAVGPVINRVFYGPPPDDEFLDLIAATLTAGLPVALRSRTAT